MGLFSWFGKSNTLYFPGCITYYKNKEIYELYQKIFTRLGVEFRTTENIVCCSLPALELGYDSEARKLARKNFEIFKEEQISEIITNSPCCYKTLLQDYPEMIPDWNIHVKNLWRIILTKLESKPHLIKNKASEKITYQDPCYLGRYCEIYEEPRKILELLGYEIKEMPDTKEEAMCCGSCGSLDLTNPKLADKIARQRILQAKRTGIKTLVTSSVNDYNLLKKNSEDTGIKVLELGEVLAIALGIKPEEKSEATNSREDASESFHLSNKNNNKEMETRDKKPLGVLNSDSKESEPAISENIIDNRRVIGIGDI